ncbi:MAG: HAD hydrolase family protein [Nitrospira sp.]|nr:HAD hydrolase family protein [Nitrospira sp.]
MATKARFGQTPARTRQLTGVLKKIRLFATDVDGVLTDGGLYYSDSGEQTKKFNVWDGLGLVLLKKAGLVTAVITMDQTPLVNVRAAKLGIAEIHQGVQDKLTVLKELSVKHGIRFEEMAYVGDDVPDLSVLQAVGFSAAPANAREPVRKKVRYVCKAKGGEGAVREVADLILAARGLSSMFTVGKSKPDKAVPL